MLSFDLISTSFYGCRNGGSLDVRVFVIMIFRKVSLLKYLFFIFCSWRESWNVPIFSPEWGGTWSKKKKEKNIYFYFEKMLSRNFTPTVICYYLGTYVFVVVILCLLLIPYNTFFLLTTFVIKNLELKQTRKTKQA